MTCRTSKACNRPETRREAQSWQRRNNIYVELGLCRTCAAQAAYGHQIGFGLHEHVHGQVVSLEGIKTPCDTCKPIVATFPIPAVRGWRKHPRAMLSGYGHRAESDSNDAVS